MRPRTPGPCCGRGSWTCSSATGTVTGGSGAGRRRTSSPLFTPIPEDRDQAFSRYEGYLLARTRARDPRFQKFGPRYEGIGGLTYNGWDQDHRLLAGFTREDFVETAKEVAARVTDAAIEVAARRMPPEWYAVDGKRLVSDLRARRDALPEAARSTIGSSRAASTST